MHKRVLSKWLRSGFLDRGALLPTTAGVPQGGIISPVISNMVLDGLEAVVHGGSWHRRVHNINYVRWADDFIVTANSRRGLRRDRPAADQRLSRRRGVRLSPTKTVITPIAQGFDFLGQTLRKHERPHGKPAKLQITPSKASLQALKAKVKALCKQAAGSTPAQLIDTLNPVLRGWANYHRHVICGRDVRHSSTTSSGGGVSDGPNGATRTKPGAGSPRATFPIIGGSRGGSPIRTPASRSSACRRPSNRSAISRSRATPIPLIPPGRRTSNTVTGN